MHHGSFLLSNIKSVLKSDTNPALEWFALSVLSTVYHCGKGLSFLSLNEVQYSDAWHLKQAFYDLLYNNEHSTSFI